MNLKNKLNIGLREVSFEQKQFCKVFTFKDRKDLPIKYNTLVLQEIFNSLKSSRYYKKMSQNKVIRIEAISSPVSINNKTDKLSLRLCLHDLVNLKKYIDY